MRTKNAKRLWPVPVTLGVMALAALLAFGLMATNGAPPAAAQDDPDCTVPSDAPAARMCSAVGDTATVKFVGLAVGEDELNRYLLIEDSSGPIRAYAVGTTYDANETPPRFEASANVAAAAPKRYRYQLVTVPKSALNAQGVREAQSVTIEVGGDVLIWADPTDDTDFAGVTAEISDAPNDERAVADDGQMLDITFLGPPALGKDLDTDHNKKLDDVILEQCVVTDTNNANDKRLVGEDTTGACDDADIETDRQQDAWTSSTLVTDMAETRSKLVVRASTGAATDADADAVIDGGTLTHNVGVAQTAVTIYARVQDAEGENLLGMPVDFVSTTEPTGIVAQRKLSDDPETKALVSNAVDDDADPPQIQVEGLSNEGADLAIEATLDIDDAVAAFTLDNLPTDTSYRITVEVSAGDLDLGTVIIARTGDPTRVVAGVFNIDCFEKDTEDDYSDATFNDEAKGCNASGMASHFGHGEMFVVKSHHEDALNLVVDGADALSVKLDDDDDNLLDGADPVDLDDPVMTDDPAQAWVYTVHEDATLGERMITVSTSEENKDGDKIDSVTLAITVAGPPHSYSVDAETMYIPLGGSGNFTVTAVDELGGLPHFITGIADRNDLVNVFVADVPSGNVRGLADGTNLMLDEDTGMGTFTLYAPRDAEQGEVARIFVSEGDSEVPLTVMFGDAPMMPGMPGMPMNVMAEATSDTEITVSWDAVMDATSYMVERKYGDGDFMTVAEMTMDTMYMDSGLMAETTYYYRVTAMNDAGSGDASDGMSMAITMAMAEDMMLTAPSGVDASYVPLTGSISMNWTPGQGANRQMVVLLGSGSAVVYNMTVTAETSVHDIRVGNDGEALAPGDYRLFVLSIAGSNFEAAAAFAITVTAN